MTIYSWFSHKKWWFSIVMLVYQRVKLTNHLWVAQLLTPPGVPFDPHDDPRHRSPAFLVSLPCCKWSKLRRRGRSSAGDVFSTKYIGIATQTNEQHVFFFKWLRFLNSSGSTTTKIATYELFVLEKATSLTPGADCCAESCGEAHAKSLVARIVSAHLIPFPM